MYRPSLMKVAGVLLGASISFNMACLASSFNVLAATTSAKMMYDFRTMASLHNWRESSDTVRTPGMSKGSFVIQRSRLFQRAVFFSMINPQPNGAGFVGFETNDGWDLSSFSAVELRVRGQGENLVYKINFKHKGQNIDDGTPSYQAFFEVPKNEWINKTVPFSDFKPYYRGRLLPDADPLDTSDITTVTLQITGGVYETYKQMGASSLEIEYIQAV